jgi:type I restriction enzyme R subunit
LNFEKLPENTSECRQFSKLFRQFNDYLEAAKVQGFVWDKAEYSFTDKETGEVKSIILHLDEKTYKILALRYKELFSEVESGPKDDSPYDLTGYLTTIDTDEIDADYMNSRFDKYRKALESGNPQDVKNARDELHKTFATLTQEEQKYANIFLHDLQTGDVSIESGKTLRDYINDYMQRAKDDQIHKLSVVLGLDENQLRKMMALKVDDTTINEYGRLDNLKITVDKTKAKSYFEALEGSSIPMFKVNEKIDELLRKFIISGGFEINIPD